MPYLDRPWPPDPGEQPRTARAWEAAQRLLEARGPAPYPAVVAAMVEAGSIREHSARQLIARAVGWGDLDWSGSWATSGRTVRLADGRPSTREGRRVISRWG